MVSDTAQSVTGIIRYMRFLPAELFEEFYLSDAPPSIHDKQAVARRRLGVRGCLDLLGAIVESHTLDNNYYDNDLACVLYRSDSLIQNPRSSFSTVEVGPAISSPCRSRLLEYPLP